jgi:hypothetical protein
MSATIIELDEEIKAHLTLSAAPDKRKEVVEYLSSKHPPAYLDGYITVEEVRGSNYLDTLVEAYGSCMECELTPSVEVRFEGEDGTPIRGTLEAENWRAMYLLAGIGVTGADITSYQVQGGESEELAQMIIRKLEVIAY